MTSDENEQNISYHSKTNCICAYAVYPFVELVENH
jgi:hypothetical protein